MFIVVFSVGGTAMNDVTQILSRIDSGDPAASDELLPLVYDELRRLAAQRLSREKPGQTLQATALVHEAFVRLVGTDIARQWNSRGHFFGAAAEAMRQLLIERARHKKRIRHGGGRQRIDLDTQLCISADGDDTLLAINDALEHLAASDPEIAQIVKLRYFAGLTLEETAATTNLSVRTVSRHWSYARAWLYRQLEE
jgi:RNA polymerase sigma factor (TIGR02999 family)